MPTGKVKWYDAEKGFGFLSQEDGEDVYVRSSALPAGVEGLKAGQKVEFGVASGRRTWAEHWKLQNALVLFNPAPVT